MCCPRRSRGLTSSGISVTHRSSGRSWEKFLVRSAIVQPISRFGQAKIIKLLLTCPAADHSLDPNTSQTAAVGGTQGYWGDFIYNYQMGVLKYDTANYAYYDQQRINRVPGNVIILMESTKPNYNTPAATAGTYKCYFTNWPDLFNSSAPAAKGANVLTLNRIGAYHNRRTKMNVTFADGHVATVNPLKDFFSNPLDQRTVKEFLWDAAISPCGSSSSPPASYQSTPTYPNGGWKPGVPAGF